MCFYNSCSKRALEVAKRYGRKTDLIEIVQEILDEQYKITAFLHPDCCMVTSDENMQTAKWGLIPHWTKTETEAKKVSNMTLNARSETVFNLPSFRVPIQTNRCLIPSTGYFEFQHNGKEVTPYYIFLKDEEIFSLAGVYEKWLHPATKEIMTSFSVLTVPANELCALIHNGGKNPFRMPLIIPQSSEEKWLDISLSKTEISDFFHPYKTELMNAYAVSKDFLKRNPKDASIIERAA